MLLELKQYGLLKISGPRALDLLQGQVTFNVEKVEHGSSRLGLMCNVKGRILYAFHMLKIDHDFYLIMRRDMIMSCINTLKRYAIFYRGTALHDVSDAYFLYGTTITNMSLNKLFTVAYAPEREIIITQSRYEISTQHDNNFWDARNIQEKIADIYPATSGKFLPQELDFISRGAVDFDKGCFTGQEIIARMHYKGKTKSQLHYTQIQTDFTLERGQDIYTNHSLRDTFSVVGTLVDFSVASKTNYHVLMLINQDALHQKIYFHNTVDTLAINLK